ncbi:hypothetical protein Tco_0847591 [Tanacetum coccineum]
MFLGSAPFSDMVYVADNLCAGIGGAGVLLAFSCAITLSNCWQPSEPDVKVSKIPLTAPPSGDTWNP